MAGVSGYLLRDTQLEFKDHRAAQRPRWRRFVLWQEAHPIRLAVAIQLPVALLAILFSLWEPRLWPRLATDTPGDSLTQLWQAHLSFVAIAFAGLALLFQLASEPVITSRSLRADLFRHTFFSSILIYCLVAAVQLGAIALWFPSSSAVVLEFLFATTASISLIGFAYFRAAKVFLSPERSLELGRNALLERALDSIYENVATAEANSRLTEVVDLTLASNGVRLGAITEEGFVRDVHMPTLREISDQLHEARLEITKSNVGQTVTVNVPSPTPDHLPPVLRRTFVISGRVNIGASLFTLEAHEGFEFDIAQLNKRLLDAVELDNSHVDRVRERFEGEASALRDNLSDAVRRNAIGTLLEGLDVYGGLLADIDREARRLSERMSQSAGHQQSDATFSVMTISEWQTLYRDLYEILGVISTQRDTRLWIESIDWVRGQALKYVGDAAGFRAFTDLIVGAWRMHLHDTSTTADEVYRAALLLRLKELSSQAALRSGDSAHRRDTTSRVIAAAFTDIIKAAIDTEQQDAAILATEYYAASSPAKQGDTPSYDILKVASMLILHGWILYRIHKDPGRDSMSDLRTTLTENIVDSAQAGYRGRELKLWDVFKAVATEQLEGVFQHTWWEMDGPGPSYSGIVSIPSYVEIAALILSPGVYIDVPKGTDNLTEADVATARSLLRALEAYSSTSYESIRNLGPGVDALASLATSLQEIVDAENLMRDREVAAVALDPERVTRFHEALVAKLRVERTRGLWSGLRTRNTLTNGADSVFGVNSNYPKWFFAKTYVSADPEQLGETLATALARAEVESIIGKIKRHSHQVGDLISLADLDEKVADRAGQLDRRDRLAFITNDWRTMQYLRRDEGALGSLGNASADSTIASYLIHDAEEPYVLAFSPNGVEIRHAAPPKTYPSDEEFPDVGILIGAKEWSDSEIAEAVEATDDEERRLELQTSVHVRVLEHLDIKVRPKIAAVAHWNLKFADTP